MYKEIGILSSSKSHLKPDTLVFNPLENVKDDDPDPTFTGENDPEHEVVNGINEDMISKAVIHQGKGNSSGNAKEIYNKVSTETSRRNVKENNKNESIS